MKNFDIEKQNSYDDNLKQLKSLFNVYLKVHTELGVDNTYSQSDSRRIIFQRCMICFRNMYINISLAKKKQNLINIFEDDYITAKGIYSMDETSIIYEYVNCGKVSMQLMVFSAIEAALRPLYRELGMGNQSDSFSKIYNSIINRFDMSEEYIKVFTILNNIRNTVHNNGVFVDSKGRNFKIEYKGFTYIFNHQYAIQDVWISNLNELYRGIVRFFKELYQIDEIKKIPFIEDRYAEVIINNNMLMDNHDLIYCNEYDAD